jgi:cytochrome c oxidase subunit 4
VTTPPATLAASAPGQPARAGRHPTARTYVTVFALLTVFTAIEIIVASLPIADPVQIPILVGLAIVKAALVALYYMHLRYDSFWYWIILLVPLGFVVLLTRYLILR